MSPTRTSQAHKFAIVFRRRADDIYGVDGELEIDSGAEVSVSDIAHGAYVEAWRWVPANDALAGLRVRLVKDHEDSDVEGDPIAVLAGTEAIIIGLVELGISSGSFRTECDLIANGDLSFSIPFGQLYDTVEPVLDAEGEPIFESTDGYE